MRPDHPARAMRIADELWNTSHDLAEACLAEPFVAGLADGSTPRAAFAAYVGQDAFFLDAFARGYALGLAASDSPAELRTWKSLLDGVFDELRLHAGYAGQWGIDLTQIEPRPACRAYTDFLLSTAAHERPAHIAAAMAPCLRLYAWLGQQLAPRLVASSPYAAWVTTYADPGFAALTLQVESLLAGGQPGIQHGYYRRAMTLELGFFRGCAG
jgi:thiaminase/transcriptional activator TenA